MNSNVLAKREREREREREITLVFFWIEDKNPVPLTLSFPPFTPQPQFHHTLIRHPKEELCKRLKSRSIRLLKNLFSSCKTLIITNEGPLYRALPPPTGQATSIESPIGWDTTLVWHCTTSYYKYTTLHYTDTAHAQLYKLEHCRRDSALMKHIVNMLHSL